MRDKIRWVRQQLVTRAGETVTSAVHAAMNPQQAANDARWVRRKYDGLPNDALAAILIRSAARKTKWEGAGNGLAVMGCEVVIALPVPESSHKIAVGSGIVALLLADIAYTTRIQIQLLLAIAELYGCPFDRDDEEDAWAIFNAALGLKGTERVGSYSRVVLVETARKQFRGLLRTGIRRAAQNSLVKVAGAKAGAYLAEKSVMRLLPFVNAGIGYAFNNWATKSVGKFAKAKAKVRSAAFQQVKTIKEDTPDALIWVLPLMFHVGTADGGPTDNLLTLYSQTRKRFTLSREQQHRAANLIDDENLPTVFAAELPQIDSEKVRKALYDLAVTTAAINLKLQDPHERCLAELAASLKVEYSESHLKEKLQYLTR